MGKVILELRVMPKDVEIDLEKIEKEIVEKVKPEKIEKEPIAFGLVAIKITKVVEEVEGVVEKLENEIRGIEGVGEVEVINLTRSI